jgi:branched-chain amino acid aminotransferase
MSEGGGLARRPVEPRGPIQIDPACAVLHYAQEIFEGLKAYRLPDGGALFRPDANARRFNRIGAAHGDARTARGDVPRSDPRAGQHRPRLDPGRRGGALYLRPFMFASETFLGVKPASEYLYMVIASPAGAYFKGGAPR